MTDQTTENAWQRFWARGGWWRSILLAAVYLLVYLGISQLIGLFVRPFIDLDDLYGDPASVLLASILPIGLMGLLLLLFARSLGWLPHLFRRRTARAPRWMWIAVVITVVPPVMKLAGTDWSRFTPHSSSRSCSSGCASGSPKNSSPAVSRSSCSNTTGTASVRSTCCRRSSSG